MAEAPSTVARVSCDEPTARRLATYVAESLDPDGCVCAAFDGGDGRWRVGITSARCPMKTPCALWRRLPPGKRPPPRSRSNRIAPADWVAASLTGLRPVTAGRFVVHGAHDRAHVAANRIGIEIEAALASAPEHHGAARGCLLALDDLAKRRRARKVLDLAHGSGVLAIAAGRAFRSRVTATDIDAVAVAAARANARLNRAGTMISFARANGCGVRFVRSRAPYDLILVNILLEPLIRMAVGLSRLAARGGRVVLSGCCRAMPAPCCRSIAPRPDARAPHRARRLGHACFAQEAKMKPPRREVRGGFSGSERRLPAAERQLVLAMRHQFAAAQFVVEWQQMPIAREVSFRALELRSLDRREEAREKALGFLPACLGGSRSGNTSSSISNSNHFDSLLLENAGAENPLP